MAVREEDSDSLTDIEDDNIPTCDQGTNTDGIYAVPPTIKRRPPPTSSVSSRSSTIRRSQTFSPACRPGVRYECKVSTTFLTTKFSRNFLTTKVNRTFLTTKVNNRSRDLPKRFYDGAAPSLNY